MGIPTLSSHLVSAQHDGANDSRPATPGFQHYDWAESPPDSRPTYVSNQLPVNKRPTMEARDAEGEQDDMTGLKDIASFLRETAPASDAKRESWHSIKKVPVSRGKLVKRYFKVGGRKAARNPSPYEGIRNRQTKTVRTVNSTTRITKSGHKYIHITPMGSPSLGSEPCELEANQERPVSPHPGTRVNVRPATALPDIAPLRIRSPNAQIPRTPAVPIRESSNADIQRHVSALQEEMQKRWQSPLRNSRSQNLKSPVASPCKRAPAAYRWTPPDQEISAILRATSPRSSPSPATPQSVRRLIQEEQQRHSPSRALSSHPAKPPSPPPSCPLPDVPRDRKPSNASSASEYEAISCHSPQRAGDAHVHPLFREHENTSRVTPSRNAVAVPPRSPLRRSLTAPQPSDGSMPEVQCPQASPHRAITGYRQPGSTAAEFSIPTIRHVSNTTPAPPSSPKVSESGLEQERPASPTPSQRREDRTRARKLRHLQVARSRDHGVFIQKAPGSLGRFDSRPSTAISSTPTAASDTTAETTFTSPAIAAVKELPQLEERECTPTPSPSSLRKGASPIPAPLRFDSNPALSRRLSQSPEPSPPFPYDDPAFSADSTLLPSSPQGLRDLLPPIHLPPLKSHQPQKDRGISSSSADSQLVNDSLPHQRLSFASTLSHLDRRAAQHGKSSRQQTSPGQTQRQTQKSPQHTAHTHQTSSTTAASGLSNAQTSSHLARSHEPSRDSLDLRVAHLERQNTLLEAALMAVLRTGGLMNGCPCQASHFSPSSTRPTSPGPQKRSSLVNKRLSALYDGAGDKKRLSSTSSAPSRLSRRLSAFPATPTSAAGRSQKQQALRQADADLIQAERARTQASTADLKRQLSELSEYSKRSGHAHSSRSQRSQQSQKSTSASTSSRCTDRSGASSDSQARRYSAALELYMATRLDVRSIPGSAAAAVVGGSRASGGRSMSEE